MSQEKNKLWALRHSAEHILMQAMQKLYPKIKMAMGPATDDGFYFDFDLDEKISNEDFVKIEKEMQKIIDTNLPITKQEISIDEARELFKNNPYKQEWLNEIENRGEKVSIYKTGEYFTDICAGPHIESTGKIGAFKLTKLAGAYWRGNEKNKMLTRIYGTAFENKNELKKYLKMLEEAEKRDHRKIGAEQELFMIDDVVGQGLVLWMPNGAILKQQIENFVLSEYQKRGYKLVVTPHIASYKLFEQSGHLSFYKEGMYSPMDIEGVDYYIKPMNCPFHVKIYKHTPKSYRDLPIRYTELGTVYRYERSGTLQGLSRVRGFTQDDAHIICTPEQLTDELAGVIELTKFILNTFGFDKFKVYLSVRDPQNKTKYLGNDKAWNQAEEGLKKALEISGWDYETDEGEAVFYGPKIDVKAFDAIGREWQISTLQLDFNLTEKFDMNYTDKDGSKKQPFMLHRALLGSTERFTSLLIEHYAGAFPLWLSPTQIVIISVSESHREHCQKLADELKEQNFRVEVWDEDETVGNKIRKAIQQKIPYMLVIGDKEINSNNLHVRKRNSDKITEINKQEFFDNVKKMIDKKSQEL
ncbi:threonine--tRNA ligase [Patescibacteria group bacterium]|nr:threonine--tRNA ligase [Patescibacteria group bacterium]MBU4482243.1 threonine--tRNA ligase [Patescibacteria group bacterium]